MTMQEKKVRAAEAELQKLRIKLDRKNVAFFKKEAIAENLGANITEEQWIEMRDTMTDKQCDAYFDLACVKEEMDDILRAIENAETRLAIAKYHAEKSVQEKTADAEAKAKNQKAADAVEGWAKDGIAVDVMSLSFIRGKTPKGLYFDIDRNRGYTNRSQHCYSLMVNGESIFTSGEFVTAYNYIKTH